MSAVEGQSQRDVYARLRVHAGHDTHSGGVPGGCSRYHSSCRGTRMCAGGMLTPCKPCNGAYSMACRRGILHMVAAAHHPCVARAMQEDSSLGPARLLVHFGNSSIDALSLVPVVLRPFVTRLLLQSSSLQLLTFDNEEVLQEVTKYIQADPSEHV